MLTSGSLQLSVPIPTLPVTLLHPELETALWTVPTLLPPRLKAAPRGLWNSPGRATSQTHPTALPQQ